MTATFHLPLFQDAFLFFQEDEAYVESKRPIRLDGDHLRFFAETMVGGVTIDRIVSDLRGPDETEAAVVARLQRSESFIIPAPYAGPTVFDAVLVDLEGENGILPDALRAALEQLVVSGLRVAVVLGYRDEMPPPGVFLLSFHEARSSPIGTRYRFFQYVRGLLGAIEPTSVFVAGVDQALFLLGTLERHRFALAARSTLTPFLGAGRCFAEVRDPAPVEVYVELLHWLHGAEEHNTCFDVVKETTAGAVAGWMLLSQAQDVLVPRGWEAFARLVPAHLPHLTGTDGTARTREASAENVARFLRGEA